MSLSPLKMPMPSPTSPPPTAPLELTTLNEFAKFFKSEDANSSLPYPTITQHCYFLRLDIKRDWHAGLAIKDSPIFTALATQIESELKNLLGLDENFKIFLVHAQKDKFSSRRILLTFVMQTIVKFSMERLEAMLRAHLVKEEKVIEMRAYARDLKVRKIQTDEYEHLRTYGCNPCDSCDQVLKRHRKIDVNHPSIKGDILCFLVIILALALAVCILLLIFIK